MWFFLSAQNNFSTNWTYLSQVWWISDFPLPCQYIFNQTGVEMAMKPFRARKAIFSSSVSKNGEVYTRETSCMKGTSVHVENMWIKQLCNRKVRDFAMASRAQKYSGAFEKQPLVAGVLPTVNFRRPGCFALVPDLSVVGWYIAIKTSLILKPINAQMSLRQAWISRNVRDLASTVRMLRRQKRNTALHCGL